MFVVFACLLIIELWSSAWKGLTSWRSCVLCFIIFITFPCGILGQVWCLIVSIPGRCLLLYRSLLSLILNTGVQSSRLSSLFVLPRYSVMSGTNELVSVTVDQRHLLV